jgi:hypothetical protein
MPERCKPRSRGDLARRGVQPDAHVRAACRSAPDALPTSRCVGWQRLAEAGGEGGCPGGVRRWRCGERRGGACTARDSGGNCSAAPDGVRVESASLAWQSPRGKSERGSEGATRTRRALRVGARSRSHPAAPYRHSGSALAALMHEQMVSAADSRSVLEMKTSEVLFRHGRKEQRRGEVQAGADVITRLSHAPDAGCTAQRQHRLGKATSSCSGPASRLHSPVPTFLAISIVASRETDLVHAHLLVSPSAPQRSI